MVQNSQPLTKPPQLVTRRMGRDVIIPFGCVWQKRQKSHTGDHKSLKNNQRKKILAACVFQTCFFSVKTTIFGSQTEVMLPRRPRNVHIQGLTPGDSEVNIMARLITSKTGNFSLGGRSFEEVGKL